MLSELPVRNSGTSWVWDYCVMDLDLLYSMLKYYIYLCISAVVYSVVDQSLLVVSGGSVEVGREWPVAISVHACFCTSSMCVYVLYMYILG